MMRFPGAAIAALAPETGRANFAAKGKPAFFSREAT